MEFGPIADTPLWGSKVPRAATSVGDLVVFRPARFQPPAGPTNAVALGLVDARLPRHTRMMLSAIQAFLPEEIACAEDVRLEEVRHLLAQVHHRGRDQLDLLSARVSRRTRDRIVAAYRVGRLRLVDETQSSLDPFAKYLCQSEDGRYLEVVRIPLENPQRFSVCVSSQIGCGLACRFCKTGEMGLVRNLEVWEIVEQVRMVRGTLPRSARITGVVFQGMGEPLANLDAVLRAVRVLSHPCGQGVDQKSITICTAGIATALRKLTAANLRVRVGLSLGSARPELRRTLMPIEAHSPLDASIDALIEHTRATKQSPMLAYTLLRNVNTFPEDAEALRNLALRVGRLSGRMPRLSLIPYNSRGIGDPFSRADAAEAERFRQSLIDAGFPVVRRYSGGADIGAACGQLVPETDDLVPASC